MPFALQSVSKPFTAALCIEQEGSAQCLLDKIGVVNTGFPFNSILATQFFGYPSVNPMLNAGAIASASLIKGANAAQRFETLLNWYMRCSGSTLSMLTDVYKSEAASNYNNRALAYILAAAGRVYCDPLEATDLYTRQCSVGVYRKATRADGRDVGKPWNESGHARTGDSFAVHTVHSFNDDAKRPL